MADEDKEYTKKSRGETSSIEGMPAGSSGGGFLTRAQRNQAAFIYDVTRHRCNCNDIESCRDCSANAVAKSLLAADMGMGREY